LVKPIIERGVVIDGFFGVNSNGKIDFDISFKNHKPDIYGLGVQRGSVFYELLKAVEASSICFQTNVDINDSSGNNHKTTLHSKIESYDGFDIVIVANGAGSLIRNKFPNFHFATQSEQGAIWTKVNSIKGHLPNKIQQVYNKTESMLGLMPIGFEQSEKEDFKLNLFYGTSRRYIENWNNIPLEEWKKDVLAISKDYLPYLDQITDKKQLVCTVYNDVLAKKFHHKNFVFIGDAAHAMGPHLSSGTNLGLLDAYFLAKELVGDRDHTRAFKKFEKKRKGQLRYYQAISRLITPYFQSEINRSFVRSYLMCFLYKVPVLKDIMLETITGRRFSLLKRLPTKYYLPKR